MQPLTEYPVSAWAHRLDLAQFLGTAFYPPLPSPLTWWIGLVALGGALAGTGVVYAVLLAWSLQTSDTLKGVGLAVLMFFGAGLGITTANGVHPGVMRNTVVDPGVFLLGWHWTATLQLLLAFLIYGSVLGTLYGRWSRGH